MPAAAKGGQAQSLDYCDASRQPAMIVIATSFNTGHLPARFAG